MTDLHERVDDSDDYEIIRLNEIERIGMGELYELAGVHIEPVAVYIGDGVFKGLHVERRGEVHSIRLGIEEHRDLQAGKTALPFKRLGQLPPGMLEDRPALLIHLLDELCVFYALAAEHDLPSAYALDSEGIKAKLFDFTDVQTRIFRGEVAVSENGDLNLQEKTRQ